jgi:hypothetical protein
MNTPSVSPAPDVELEDGGQEHRAGHGHHGITIKVNNEPVHMPKVNATGAEIKHHAHVPPHETLYFVSGQDGDVPVADDEDLHLHEGECFETSPDGGVS